MPLRFKWDQRSMHRLSANLRGVEIHRGCLVTGIPVVNGITGTDPEVFIKVLADPDCPKLASGYPSTVYPYSAALLAEINPETTGPNQPNNSARIDFVYRVNQPPGATAGANVWTVTEGGQGSYVETYATSAGGAALTVWYRKGEATSTTVLPTSTNDRPTALKGVRGIHRFYPQRTLRVTGQLVRADWLAARAAIRAASGYINSDTWGGDTRGQWLFLFPISRANDFAKTYVIELNFIRDENGHFPLGIYVDEHGQHPADSASDGDVRTGGPPAENTYKGRNGIMMASVAHETAFSPLFAFTPND